jgi:hypothetical protein
VTTDDRGWRRSGAEERTLKSQLARDWAQAVASVAYRPITRAEIELYLRSHLETLHDALLADPFSAEPGRRIGAGLVRIHLTRPEAVEETLVLLADRLLTDLGLDTYTFQPHLNRLLGALAHGFTRALRDRALGDLEQTYCAALTANLGAPPVQGPARSPGSADPAGPPGPADPRGSPAPPAGASGRAEAPQPDGPTVRSPGPAGRPPGPLADPPVPPDLPEVGPSSP